MVQLPLLVVALVLLAASVRVAVLLLVIQSQGVHQEVIRMRIVCSLHLWKQKKPRNNC
nr:unknown protein [Arabidopsis thaliana]